MGEMSKAIPIGLPQVTDVTDLAVARAIGLDAVLYEGKLRISHRQWDELRGIPHHTCEGSIAYIPFQPSTDLNAAFAAAEKVGLLHQAYLTCREVQWCVEKRRSGWTLAVESTAALAICVAILKLKEG